MGGYTETGNELGTPGCYMKFDLCVNSFAHFWWGDGVENRMDILKHVTLSECQILAYSNSMNIKSMSKNSFAHFWGGGGGRLTNRRDPDFLGSRLWSCFGYGPLD